MIRKLLLSPVKKAIEFLLSADGGHLMSGAFLYSIIVYPFVKLDMMYTPIGIVFIYATIREIGQNYQWWGYHRVQELKTMLRDIAFHVLGAVTIFCINLLHSLYI